MSKINLFNFKLKLDYLPFILIITILASLLFLFEENTFYFDDAFITYRYAKNLADGNGLVYNTGEKVYGTTTPLYAISLALLHKTATISSINNDIHLISKIIAIIFLSCTLFLIQYKIKANSFFLFLITLLFLSSATNYSVIFSGMEIMFVLFFLFICLFSFDWKYAGMMVPLTILLRFDVGIILLFTFIIYKVLFYFGEMINKKQLVRDLGFTSISLFIVMIFLFGLFEAIIPNTILAKSVIYRDTVFQQKLTERLIQLLRMGFPIFISVPIMIFALLLFIKKILKKEYKFIQFYIYAFGFLLFEILFVTVINAWYIPLFNIFFILFLYLESYSFRILEKKFCKNSFYLFLLLIIFYTANKNTYLFNNRKDELYKSDLYKLSQIIEPNSSVFCGDIGVIGYYSNAYIYDYAGLITPKAINFNRAKEYYRGFNNYSISVAAILEQINSLNPKYLVLRDSYPHTKKLLDERLLNEKYLLKLKLKQEYLFIRK